MARFNLRTPRGTTTWLKAAPVALLLACPALMLAQLNEGAITGTVTDSQGAVVPHATVQLKQAATGLALSADTDSRGVYVFQPLKVGTYSITVTKPGFAASTVNGLEVHVSERLEANATLPVGGVNEAVQVNASSAPLLQTEGASTGQVITSRVINDVPLAGRNYVFIAQETAGIPPSNGSRGQGNGDFTANGMRATQNNFILDGVDNNSNSIDFLNGASYVVKPPPDALQEFKVQTGSFSAEFGHSAGAVINATIKSGTNQVHGDVWEYIRNNDLGSAAPEGGPAETARFLHTTKISSGSPLVGRSCAINCSFSVIMKVCASLSRFPASRQFPRLSREWATSRNCSIPR